jgi:hypothetical protein
VGPSWLSMMTAENAAPKQRTRGKPFRKGRSGNPQGKAPGTRNRATLIAERPLDGEAETMVRKVIEKAKRGDTFALRFCLDRIVPVCRDRPVYFQIPDLKSADDASRAMAAITSAVASGELALFGHGGVGRRCPFSGVNRSAPGDRQGVDGASPSR